MSAPRRAHRLALVALVASVAGALVGCGSIVLASPDADADADGGCESDACAPSPPPRDLDAGGGSNSFEGLPADTAAASVSPEVLATCYDGQDNDHDTFFDCAAPGCAQLASCCVGATSLDCCPSQELIASMTLTGCSGPLDLCAPIDGTVGFGSPSPIAIPDPGGDSALDRVFPNGDATDDSGLALTKPLDPHGAIVVSGVLATPVGDCGEGCFESVALGLIPVGAVGSAVTLRPLVAVVASAARAEVALVLNGDTAARLTLRDANEVRVQLVVLPTGVVSLHVTDALTNAELGALTGRIVPSDTDLQLAVYGHNVNRSGTLLSPSYARDVSARTALCDAPSRWLTRTALPIGAGAASVGSASAPSFAYGGGQTFVAFASEGQLVFGRADGEDVSHGFALLGMNGRYARPGEVLSDPDVHYDEPVGGAPAKYTVYFANRTTKSIWRMVLALDGTPLGDATEWLAPALDDAFLESIDGPSVLRPTPGTSGLTFVFARILTKAGDTRIVRFGLATEGSAFETPSDWDALTVRTTQPSFGAFDRDEVASPAAYRQNGSLQVAFAGRSGARWALGLMATDDPRVALWRRAPAPTILTGDGSGFDALSVRDPAIITSGTTVDLLYTGSDGATDTLGYAHRLATDHLPVGP